MVTTGRHNRTNFNAVADARMPGTKNSGPTAGMGEAEEPRARGLRPSRIPSNPSIQGKVPSNGGIPSSWP
jgi:hypothetical protein